MLLPQAQKLMGKTPGLSSSPRLCRAERGLAEVATETRALANDFEVPHVPAPQALPRRAHISSWLLLIAFPKGNSIRTPTASFDRHLLSTNPEEFLQQNQ